MIDHKLSKKRKFFNILKKIILDQPSLEKKIYNSFIKRLIMKTTIIHHKFFN